MKKILEMVFTITITFFKKSKNLKKINIFVYFKDYSDDDLFDEDDDNNDDDDLSDDGAVDGDDEYAEEKIIVKKVKQKQKPAMTRAKKSKQDSVR